MITEQRATLDWSALLVGAVHRAAERLDMPPEDVGLGLAAWLDSVKNYYAPWFQYFAQLSRFRQATGKLYSNDAGAAEEEVGND